MGKRKSSRKPQAKKKMEPLSTEFKCLFCNYEKAVSVKLDKQKMFGALYCKMCGQSFTTPITHLSQAVDCYCDWIDACEEVRLQQPAKKAKSSRASSPRAPSSKDKNSSRPAVSRDEDDEDHVVDDDEDEDEDGHDRHKESKRRPDRYDDEDDEDEDEDDDRNKRRRVVNDYDDEDEEE